MDNQLESKNIIISAVEVLDWGMKIKDEKTLVYNVPMTVKSGENAGNQTRAYQDLSKLPNNGIGLNKCVKFVTVPNKQGGTSRYVRMITEPVQDGQPTQYKSPAMSNDKPVVIEKEHTDWDKINADKRADIKWMNALNNASLLCKKDFTIDNGVETLENFKKTLYDLANYIYNLEPINIQDANKIAKMVGGRVVNEADANQHQGEQEQNEIDTSSIPF